MDQYVVDQIEELKYHTSTNLKNINKGKIPTLVNMPMSRRFSYYIHGTFYSMYKDDSMLFVVKDLPYTPYQKRHSYTDTLLNLVKSGEVYPFLLFLDGTFIKWSDITIIRDCKYSYIIVSGFRKDHCIINTILIPDMKVDYNENQSVIDSDTLFAFDTNGLYSAEAVAGNTYTTIKSQDLDDLFYTRDKTVLNVKTKIVMDESYKTFKDNLFIFKDGLLYDHDNLKLYGLNVFTVKDENRDLRDPISYVYCYYKKSNMAVDNITTIGNKDDVVNEMVMANGVRNYFLQLNKDFDFEFEKTYEYSRNVEESLSYIMKYNPDLMNGMYKKRSNIIFRTYTGKELLEKANPEGRVVMSRKLGDSIDNYVMIFCNGLLYRYYCEMQYENKNFKFPVRDLKDDDVIEILYFKNIDNRVTKFTFFSGDDKYDFQLDSSIDVTDAKLFSTENEEKIFDLERRETVQYEVNFIARRSGSYIDMRPVNPYFFDKTLSLVSNRQFRYTCKYIKEDTISIGLPATFAYCNEEGKYMVFLNGRKLSSTHYKLTLVKPTRPFDEIRAYLNIKLAIGDRIEVFYAGDDLTEVYTNDDLSLSGNIVLDKSKLRYGFDKDLYMVFINGKKMNPANILNIANNRLQILTDSNSTKNVSIIRYVKEDEKLANIFFTTTDILSSVYDKLPEDLIQKIFKKDTMTNTEDDINSKKMNSKYILTEIIKRFWSTPFVNSGNGELLYDYDTNGLESEGGVFVSDVFNGEKSYDEFGNEVIEIPPDPTIPTDPTTPPTDPTIPTDPTTPTDPPKDTTVIIEMLKNLMGTQNSNNIEALNILTGNVTDSALDNTSDQQISELLENIKKNAELMSKILSYIQK